MSDDEVTIQEAWYVCPEHGPQHHPHGPDIVWPCHECVGPLTPIELVDREELLARYPKPEDDAS